MLAALATVGSAAAALLGTLPGSHWLRLALAALIMLITVRAVLEQSFGLNRAALSRVVLQSDGSWRLQFAGSAALTLRRLTSGARIGHWWFLHWGAAWVVVTPRAVGEQDWRRLSARLRDAGGVAERARNASTGG